MRSSRRKQKRTGTTSPRVSIGLPVYNGAAFLERTLDALLAQTFDDFEIIISDNASTDGTESICRRYAARDPRIRYYRQARNLGSVPNYNHVLALARGELFKWAACDDVCDPTYLARCVTRLDADPSVVWCHTRTVAIDHAGHRMRSIYDRLGPAREPEPGRRPSPPHRRFRRVLLTDGWISRYFGVMRTAAIRACRPLMPYYGGERVQMAELILRGRYVEVPKTLFAYRHHPGASAQLATAAAQQWFCDTRRSSRLAFPRVHFLLGYIAAALRAPIGAADRLWCGVWIFSYLFQVKKWRLVLLSVWHGTGTGVERLYRANSRSRVARRIAS